MDRLVSAQVWRIAECRTEQKEAYSSHSLQLFSVERSLFFSRRPELDLLKRHDVRIDDVAPVIHEELDEDLGGRVLQGYDISVLCPDSEPTRLQLDLDGIAGVIGREDLADLREDLLLLLPVYGHTIQWNPALYQPAREGATDRDTADDRTGGQTYK